MTSETIHVGLIEDNHRFRASLQKYFDLTESFQVVLNAESVEFALENIKSIDKIDILLLDIGLPGMSGLEGIGHLKKIKPEVNIMMLTTYTEEEKILKALCAGASAYMAKTTSLSDLAKAIEIVYNGGSFMSPIIAKEIVTYFARGKTETKENILTTRQTEIMELMIDGNTYSSIAHHLKVSSETIKSHIKAIYSNLHVNNKAQAIVKYMNG